MAELVSLNQGVRLRSFDLLLLKEADKLQRLAYFGQKKAVISAELTNHRIQRRASALIGNCIEAKGLNSRLNRICFDGVIIGA